MITSICCKFAVIVRIIMHYNMRLIYLIAIGLTALVATSSAPAGGDGNTEETAVSCEGNPVIEAIMGRRSIRAYKDTPVEREKLLLIAQCGVHAPNAMNRQNWEVRIIDSPAYIARATELFLKANPNVAQRDPNFKNMFRNAPAVIAVAGKAGKFTDIDCGLLGENIMLAAYSLGLGTCCLGGAPAFIAGKPETTELYEALQLSEGYELLYMIAVGYPDEEPQAKPRDYSKIQFVEYPRL